MKTVVVNTKSIQHRWYLVDAENKVLGRLASRLAAILMGKGKPAYSPNQDHGDHVVVINTNRIRVTGKKADAKIYARDFSRRPGGLKTRTYRSQMRKDSTLVLVTAVRRMVPRNALGRAVMKKLHAYPESTHPHQGQAPQALDLG